MIPLIIGAVCGLVMILITLGTFWTWPKRKSTPAVTIIVCARDEEEHLFDCLMSLATQDYPDERINLVLVDHLSRDNSGRIMENFAQSSPVKTTVVRINRPHDILEGKIHALVEAMKHVETEHVLLTDADCIVPESWVRSMVGCFSEGVVAVGGMVAVGPDENPTGWVGRLQNVDHRFFMGLVGGLSGIAGYLEGYKPDSSAETKKSSLFHPTFVSGNNLGFRLSVYKAAGGFEAIGPSLIEDYTLLTRMVRKTGGHLAFTLMPEARVQTHPLTTVHALWRQKRRWATATNSPHALSYLLYVIVFASRIVLPWFVLFKPVEAIAGLVLTGIGSTIVLRRVNKLTGLSLRNRDILIHEIYQIILNHALFVATIVRWPVFWKGEKYPHKGS